MSAFQVALVRHIHAGLMGSTRKPPPSAVLGQAFLQCVGVVVGNAQEAGSHGTVVGVGLGVVAHGDDGDGTAVEVAFAADNHHFVVGDALLDHTPTAGQLQGRLAASAPVFMGKTLS